MTHSRRHLLQMEGATEVSCSAFGDAIVGHIRKSA